MQRADLEQMLGRLLSSGLSSAAPFEAQLFMDDKKPCSRRGEQGWEVLWILYEV